MAFLYPFLFGPLADTRGSLTPLSSAAHPLSASDFQLSLCLAFLGSSSILLCSRHCLIPFFPALLVPIIKVQTQFVAGFEPLPLSSFIWDPQSLEILAKIWAVYFIPLLGNTYVCPHSVHNSNSLDFFLAAPIRMGRMSPLVLKCAMLLKI